MGGCLTGTKPTQFPDQDEKERHEEDSQEGGGEHTAEDAGSDGIAACSAGTGGKHERNDAENKRHRGHDDRAEAQAGRFDR